MKQLERRIGSCAYSLRRHSINGGPPGYDISYTDHNGINKGIEVKGTDLAQMTSFELTDNELNAAKKLRNNYIVWLVLNVEKNTTYETITDPFGRAHSEDLEISPSNWLVRGFITDS